MWRIIIIGYSSLSARSCSKGVGIIAKLCLYIILGMRFVGIAIIIIIATFFVNCRDSVATTPWSMPPSGATDSLAAANGRRWRSIVSIPVIPTRWHWLYTPQRCFWWTVTSSTCHGLCINSCVSLNLSLGRACLKCMHRGIGSTLVLLSKKFMHNVVHSLHSMSSVRVV